MTFIKKIILMLSISLGSICSFASVQIEHITVGPQGNDPKDKFSLLINLTSTRNLDNWQLGFYMPRLFRTTSVSNTKLNMSICDANKKTPNCSNLIYAKNKFTANDLSSGFTTIIKPSNQFTLSPHHKYIIKLTHNSSQGPKNYSSLPQSFFLIHDDKITNLPTKPSQYSITTYDNGKVQVNITKKLTQEWESSNNIEPIINVIPTPQQVTLTNESYELPDKFIIHNLANLSADEIALWKSAITKDLDISIKIDNTKSNKGITLTKIADNELKNPEGYNLTITTTGITIQASNEAGFFYALQTLRQLWFKNKQLPTLIIQDAPRFKYRGLMLDVARHFLTTQEIKQTIDLMAANKLNTLHLHLSDDEAFRLELADYPELANIGAVRGFGQVIGPKAMIQHNLSKSGQHINTATIIEKGSYSKTDILELIKYANRHQITIIPEIDIPGHSRALMKALSNIFYESADISEYPGYGDNALPICAYNGNDIFSKNFTTTINDILLQTASLFNNQTTLYAINDELGIGGDEVGAGTWNNSPLCNNSSEWKDLPTLSKEHHFLDLLNNTPAFASLKLSGWHEFVLNHDNSIGKHTITPQETAHIWVWGNYKSSLPKAVTLINNDYPTILAYSDSLYFDMPYTANLKEPGLYWATQFGDTYAALTSARMVDNTMVNLQSQKSKNIIGIEAALWADVIPDFVQLQYMMAPKIAGLAEASWAESSITNQNGLPNWHSLVTRLGCDNKHYLGYISHVYDIKYRGYPHGISLEAPYFCNQTNLIEAQ